MKSHSKSSSLGTPCLTKKHKDITAKHQDGMIAGSTYRIYSCHFAGSTLFYFTKAREGRWGLGVVVNGHTHRYVLILPAKRVFFLFGAKASFGEDSSLRPSTSGGRKCLVEPPA